MRRKLKILILRWLLKGTWANVYEDLESEEVMTYYDLDKDLQGSYQDLDENSKQYPLVFDGTVLRFQANPCVRYFVDSAGLLNDMWLNAHRDHWKVEDLMMFYRMMGYSLSGFLEVFVDYDYGGNV